MSEEIKKEETVASEKKCSGKECFEKCKNNPTMVAVVLIVLLGITWYAKSSNFSFGNIFSKNLTKQEAQVKVENFIKENGLTATVKEVVEENGLYRVKVSFGQQDVDSYLTKDGSKFFPQAIDINKKNDQPAAPEAKTIVEAKKDIPEIELFVMSYCPYGTQMEKGMLPVLDALGNKVKFSLKFVDYAMHMAQGEVEENIRQYCIQKEEPNKFNAYLKCFLKKGGEVEAKNCLRTVGVNVAKNDACFKTTDDQFEITKSKNDKSTWNGGQFPPFNINKNDAQKYGVQGSPTLVINGETISSGRDPQSILTAVCSGFANKPAECDKKLPAETLAPGFGDGKAAVGGANPAASCGN